MPTVPREDRETGDDSSPSTLSGTAGGGILKCMTTLKDIQAAISRLSPKDVRRIHSWLDEFDAQAWDEQLESDVQAGRLDALADQAVKDSQAGRCKPL